MVSEVVGCQRFCRRGSWYSCGGVKSWNVLGNGGTTGVLVWRNNGALKLIS